MQFESVTSLCDATVRYRHEQWDKDAIGQVIASDLMSDVLLRDCDYVLLVTSLNTTQAMRTAEVIGALGVMVVNGKKSDTSMVALAQDLGIALLNTNLDKFTCCGRLYQELYAE